MKKPEEPRVAENCGECHFQFLGACHRHAPGTTEAEFEIALWPPVNLTDWCLSGMELNPDEPMPTCGECAAWDHPDGGLEPDYDAGMPRAWWAETGRCRRFSPGPSGFERDPTRWLVTHRDTPCGDARKPPGDTTMVAVCSSGEQSDE